MSTVLFDHEVVESSTQLAQGDMVIALMGSTGSGKSNIIDKLLGGTVTRAVSDLHGASTDVVAIRIKNHVKYKNRLVILDTPGFDDAQTSDLEVLEMISKWLIDVAQRNIHVKGILYLHRITDNRMAGTPHRNLCLFSDLCGEKGAIGVVLVTTMWDVLKKVEVGEAREDDLRKNFWKSMLENNASDARFFNTHESAWEIITKVAENDTTHMLLLLQEEMVELGRELQETKAAQGLLADFQRLQAKQKKMLAELKSSVKKEKDPHAKLDLESKIEKMELQVEEFNEAMHELYIPFGRRIKLFFQRRPTGRILSVV